MLLMLRLLLLMLLMMMMLVIHRMYESDERIPSGFEDSYGHGCLDGGGGGGYTANRTGLWYRSAAAKPVSRNMMQVR